VRLQVGPPVEVVDHRRLAPPGDQQNVGDARGRGLLDDVLQHRSVDDRQQLLRHRLGGREESGGQPGGWDDCLDGASVSGVGRHGPSWCRQIRHGD
jgi:hypothetical protein